MVKMALSSRIAWKWRSKSDRHKTQKNLSKYLKREQQRTKKNKKWQNETNWWVRRAAKKSNTITSGFFLFIYLFLFDFLCKQSKTETRLAAQHPNERINERCIPFQLKKKNTLEFFLLCCKSKKRRTQHIEREIVASEKKIIIQTKMLR